MTAKIITHTQPDCTLSGKADANVVGCVCVRRWEGAPDVHFPLLWPLSLTCSGITGEDGKPNGRHRNQTQKPGFGGREGGDRTHLPGK